MRRPSFAALLTLLAIATAVPLWCANLLPFADIAEQVAVIATLRHWGDPAWSAPYVFQIGRSQYVLYHLVGAALAFPLGSAELANRVLLSGVAISTPFAMRSLLRAMGRDERLAVFSIPAFWSRGLMMGFLPYVAAMPMVLWGLALAIRNFRAPTARRTWGLSAWSAALFFVHLDGFVVFVATVICLQAVDLEERGGAHPWRGMLRDLVWLLPAVSIAALWSVYGSLTDSVGQGDVVYLPIARVLRELPLWQYDIFLSHVDEACSFATCGAFAFLLLQRGGGSRDPLAFVPVVVALALYFVMPYSVGAAGMLNLRLAAFVGLFAPLAIARVEGARALLPIAVVVVADLVLLADAGYELHRIEHEDAGNLSRLIDRIPKGARVATLPFRMQSPRVRWTPWVFAGSYHRARGGGVASFSFTEISHWPLHYREGAAPPAHPLFWTFNPCLYRNEIDGPFYDYILTRGDVDPFRDAPPGPVFRRVDAERDFVLYERTDATSPSWAFPDEGPCESRRSLEMVRRLGPPSALSSPVPPTVE